MDCNCSHHQENNFMWPSSTWWNIGIQVQKGSCWLQFWFGIGVTIRPSCCVYWSFNEPLVNPNSTGWWFGTFFFPIQLGISSSQLPTDFHSIIFQRVGIPPTQTIIGEWHGGLTRPVMISVLDLTCFNMVANISKTISHTLYQHTHTHTYIYVYYT